MVRMNETEGTVAWRREDEEKSCGCLQLLLAGH